MTLFRQIAIITTLGFVVLISTVMWNNVRQSSHFLQGQLQTAAQDMATTLGITVANAAPDQNIAVIETFVNATFDSGYYSKIELVSTDGETLFIKSRDISLGSVPGWFIDLVPLSSAVGSSQIIMGWLPYGTLKVTLHPGYVYSGLYTNLKASGFWAIIVALGGLAVLWVLLKFVLKPLARVRKQAEAIQDNEFIIQEDIPKTKELNQVVLAMNKMIVKVKTVFDEQTNMLQRYQNLKFKDEETGLSNRLHFITKVENICKDEMASGGMLIGIRLEGFSKLCDQEGYDGAKKVLASLTEITQKHLKEHVWSLFGRLNKTEFAIYLPGTIEHADETVANIFSDFKKLNCSDDRKSYLWLYAGGVTVDAGAKLGTVLSSMDLVVTQAENAGVFAFTKNIQSDLVLPEGKNEWRKWLLSSIENNRFFVVGQTVYNLDKSEFHQELFVRLHDEENRVISAGVFMPVATSLGLEFDIDQAVLNLIKELKFENKEGHIALNVSASFLSRADALTSLFEFIDVCSKTNKKVFIEITHMAFNRNLNVVKIISERLKKAGFALGIDHLDLNNSIESLKEIRPDYVKMNAKQLVNMVEDGVSAGVQALLTLVNGLDVKLIAVGIDSEYLHEQIMEIGVDGMQGKFYGDFKEL